MTPLARTLVAIVSAEPNEWTVATLAEDLDVSERAIRQALGKARMHGHDLRVALSPLAVRVRQADTAKYSVTGLARHLRTSAHFVKAAIEDLKAAGHVVAVKAPRKPTTARVLALYRAYPGAHPVKWYAEHVPATIPAVRSAVRRLKTQGIVIPLLNWHADHGHRIKLTQVLTEAGHTREQIAAEIGVRPETVRDYLRRPTRHRWARA